MDIDKDVTVSIAMITYNHEGFISQAIEGVLMQQTSFPFELIIGEDCSTDNTRQICIEYREKYPEIIRLLLPEKNLGAWDNMENVLNVCRGKYISFCEGDDYWTDPLKLQKQIDFLESHPDYSLCAGRFKTLYEGGSELSDDWLVKVMKRHPDGMTVTLDDFLYPYKLLTLTICLRTECIRDLSKFGSHIKDDIMWAAALEIGKGFIFSDTFGVYRRHQGGIWSCVDLKSRLLNQKKYTGELYKHYGDISRSIRKCYYILKLDLLFFDLSEKRNKPKVCFEMAKLIFSDKIGLLPFRIRYLFIRIGRNVRGKPY